MDFDTAKRIIDDEFKFVENSKDFDEIEFDFMGGEPFCSFDLIKKIISYVVGKNPNVPYIFFATTNATLINNEIKEYLEENKSIFVVGISYDGKFSQEVNRTKNDVIDIDYFFNLYPFQPLKVTISPYSVKSLSEDIISLHKNGYEFIATCSFGQYWSEEDYLCFRSELLKISNFYIQNPDISICNLFDNKLIYVDCMHEHRKYCGSGKNMIAYDVDGASYPCHMFTSVVLGRKMPESVKRELKNASFTSEECLSCSYVDICPTCYGFNFKDRGDISKRDKCSCRLFKIQMEVVAYLHIELVKRKIMQGKQLSAEEICGVKNIKKLNKQIFNQVK